MSRASLQAADIRSDSPRRAGLTREEVRWLAIVTVLTMLVVELPYLIAYAQVTRGIVFAGMLWSPHDFAQYAAAMREGAESSSWLMHDHLTAEPHKPIFMYPLYVGLGKLSALLGLDVQAVYHAAELVARTSLLVAVYVFCSAILHSVRLRRTAFLLIVLSSGLAFLLAPLNAVFPLMVEGPELLTTELNWPEMSTFLTLFTAPHLMLGLALLLLAARRYLVSWSRVRVRGLVVTVLIVVGLGLTNPFSLVTLCAALPIHLAVSRVCCRCLSRGAILTTAVVVAAGAPFLLYNLLVFGADPFWSVPYGRQNLTPSPPPQFLAAGLAPLLLLAIVGLSAFLRGSAPDRGLVLVWVLVSIGLMYAPVGVQRRFAFGLQPMLGVIAAVGLERLARRLWAQTASRPALSGRILQVGLVASLVVPTAIPYALLLTVVTHPTERDWGGGTFQPRSVTEAGRWLAGAAAADDVILADTSTGNYLAGVVRGRVFVGHWAATVRFEAKEAAMAEFYRSEDEASRRSFVAAHRIDYVVYGPHERAIGARPVAGSFLRPVYAVDDVAVYRVEAGQAAER